mgnify:CR=1 FL=1
MNKNILINQTVAILCDGNNIERSIHEQSNTTNAMVNFDTLIPRLLDGRGLNRLIYFREGKNISSKLAERLHNNFYGSVVACHKTADIPLSIKATQLASKVDTIIIMSGDSDFIDLVQHLKREGVRVEIAAIKKTTSRILAEEADYFHPITREDWFVYKKPNQRSWDKKNGAKTSTTKAPNVTPNIMPSTAIPSSKPNTAKPNITKPNITTPQNPPKIASSPKPKEIPLPKTTDTPKIIKSTDISKPAVSVPTKTNEKTISAKPSKKQKIITKSVKKSSPTKKKVEKS